MTLAFKKIALIGKRHPSSLSLSQQTFSDILTFLTSLPAEVFVEDQTAAYLNQSYTPTLTIAQIRNTCDVVIVVGGDGTMLGIGCALAQSEVPIIGINHGRLGFITDIPLTKYREILPAIISGDYETDERPFLTATITRATKLIHQSIALNDLVLARSSTNGMIEVSIKVDNQFVANQRADGLIISTATGSTAYNLAAGGPLMHPKVEALIITPLAAHNLSNRPIVVAQNAVIELQIIAGHQSTVSFDGHSFPDLHQGDNITVKTAPYTAKFLHHRGWNYFKTLYQKLGWNA